MTNETNVEFILDQIEERLYVSMESAETYHRNGFGETTLFNRTAGRANALKEVLTMFGRDTSKFIWNI